MKSKPIVMEHYHKVHTAYVVDFTFTTNITFLTGDSGQGKSAVFHSLRKMLLKIHSYCASIIWIGRKTLRV